VTSRGFNGRFANKMLVLVDGRSVYSPFFSGVYWEQLHVNLADVDRIEGPAEHAHPRAEGNGLVLLAHRLARHRRECRSLTSTTAVAHRLATLGSRNHSRAWRR